MSSEGTLNAGDAVMENMNEPSRPWWPVGLALLGLVVVLLVGAVLVARQLRPQVGVEPVPQTPAAVQPTSAARAAPAATAAVVAVPTAATAATSAALPGVRIGTSALEREIEDAYLRYWEVLKQAYLSLDTSSLGEVTAGAELARQEQQIRDLRSRGRAAKLEVDHRIAFANVSAERAVVYDEYLNRSLFVDAATKQELPTKEQPETEKISFEMRKINGTWKVVDAAQHG